MQIGDIVEFTRDFGTDTKVGDERFVFGLRDGLVYVDCGMEMGWLPQDFFKVKVTREQYGR